MIIVLENRLIYTDRNKFKNESCDSATNYNFAFKILDNTSRMTWRHRIRKLNKLKNSSFPDRK